MIALPYFKRKIMKALTLLTLLLCSSAYADQDQHRRPGPPPEALEACNGKAPGSAVEMRTPRGDTVKGVCRMVLVPDQDQPSNRPNGSSRRP
jgi:hypothetical protein